MPRGARGGGPGGQGPHESKKEGPAEEGLVCELPSLMRGSKRRPGAHPRAVAEVTPGGHRATRNSQGAETAQCPTTDKWTNKTGRTQTTERYSAVTGSTDARYDRTNPENPVLGGSSQTRKASRRGIPRMRKVQTRKATDRGSRLAVAGGQGGEWGLLTKAGFLFGAKKTFWN